MPGTFLTSEEAPAWAEGSCVCGAVRYEVDGSLGDVRYCHCNHCRRTTGTAFNANARIPARAFRLVARNPDVRITAHEPSGGGWQRVSVS